MNPAAAPARVFLRVSDPGSRSPRPSGVEGAVCGRGLAAAPGMAALGSWTRRDVRGKRRKERFALSSPLRSDAVPEINEKLKQLILCVERW